MTHSLLQSDGRPEHEELQAFAFELVGRQRDLHVVVQGVLQHLDRRALVGPDQRDGAAVFQNKGDHQHGLVVLVEVGPVHGDLNLLAITDHEPHEPVAQVHRLDLLVRHEAVDLLDAVLGVALAAGSNHRRAKFVDGHLHTVDDAEGDEGDTEHLLVVEQLSERGLRDLEQCPLVELPSPLSLPGDRSPARLPLFPLLPRSRFLYSLTTGSYLGDVGFHGPFLSRWRLFHTPLVEIETALFHCISA